MQTPEWFTQFEKRFEEGRETNHAEHEELKLGLKAMQDIETNCQINHLPHIQSRLGEIEKKVVRLRWVLLTIGVLALGLLIDNPEALKNIIEILKTIL